MRITAHGPERAITLEEEGVVVAHGDISDIGVDNLCEVGAEIDIAGTQLAVVVIAARPEGAISSNQECGVRITGTRRTGNGTGGLVGQLGWPISRR